MKATISDTVEYGCCLYDRNCVPLLADFMKTVDTDVIGRGLQVNDTGVDNAWPIEVNTALREHPVEVIGRELRGYTSDMERIVRAPPAAWARRTRRAAEIRSGSTPSTSTSTAASRCTGSTGSSPTASTGSWSAPTGRASPRWRQCSPQSPSFSCSTSRSTGSTRRRVRRSWSVWPGSRNACRRCWCPTAWTRCRASSRTPRTWMAAGSRTGWPGTRTAGRRSGGCCTCDRRRSRSHPPTRSTGCPRSIPRRRWCG